MDMPKPGELVCRAEFVSSELTTLVDSVVLLNAFWFAFWMIQNKVCLEHLYEEFRENMDKGQGKG